MQLKKFLSMLLVVGLIAGCASTKVRRTQVEKVVDYSGQWNDTDSRLVAEEMIKDCLAHNWIGEFNKAKGHDPIVIVGTVLNRSHEHVDSLVFTKDLERAFINSGKVEVVASKDERLELREERQDQQQGHTAVETRSPLNRETGADYMVKGTVNSIKDAIKKKHVILYQINLELIDLATNRKVWLGQKKIKKEVKRRGFSF